VVTLRLLAEALTLGFLFAAAYLIPNALCLLSETCAVAEGLIQ
jgi:hypothetical protein